MLFYKHKDKLMFFYKHKYKLMFFLKIQRQSWWSSENTKNRKMYFCNIKQKKSWFSAWQTQRRKARQKIISFKLVFGIFLIVTTTQSCLSPDIHYKVCCWWPGKSQRCATSTAKRGSWLFCRLSSYLLLPTISSSYYLNTILKAGMQKT